MHEVVVVRRLFFYLFNRHVHHYRSARWTDTLPLTAQLRRPNRNYILYTLSFLPFS